MTITRTLSNAGKNDDGTLVITTHEPCKTYAVMALRNPRLVTVEFSEHDLLGFIDVVRELEAIDWTDRHYHAEDRSVMVNRVPGKLTRFSNETYVLTLPGVNLHYSRSQLLEAVAALEKERLRLYRLQFTH